MDAETRAAIRLHLTPGIGRASLLRLRRSFGSFAAALAASPAERSTHSGLPRPLLEQTPDAAGRQVQSTLERLTIAGVRVLLDGDPAYPEALRQLHDPPPFLYVRGELPQPLEALAIVGARRATDEVCLFVRRLAADLAGRGITIVSGLARGIDTVAHLGAVDAGGRTLGVLGSGILRIYPAENRTLAEDCLGCGGALLSEQAPDAPPLQHHFPARNRLISALARGVLVAQAATGSGSLITADFALEQGRDVFALPGPPYAHSCAGSNDLLKQGAQPVTCAADILERLWPGQMQRPAAASSDFASRLSGTALELYRLLAPTPQHIDEITRESGLTPSEVSATLLDLELQGGVGQLPGMRYFRRF